MLVTNLIHISKISAKYSFVAMWLFHGTCSVLAVSFQLPLQHGEVSVSFFLCEKKLLPNSSRLTSMFFQGRVQEVQGLKRERKLRIATWNFSGLCIIVSIGSRGT